MRCAARLAENSFAAGGLVDYTGPVLRLANLTPEDMYVLLDKLRHVYASGDAARYLVPDEALLAFMDHCCAPDRRRLLPHPADHSQGIPATSSPCSSRTPAPTGARSSARSSWPPRRTRTSNRCRRTPPQLSHL